MRTISCLLMASLIALALGTPARAALFSIWPANFTYGTPSGGFTWNSLIFGARFDEPLGGAVFLRASLLPGIITNLSFSGSPLSGYSGLTGFVESSYRVGFGTGQVSVSAYGGVGGMLLYAYGPATGDNVFLGNIGGRLGVEAIVSASPGIALRGSYTIMPSLTSTAAIFMSSPSVSAVWRGAGTGSEGEVALTYTPAPETTWFAGYRSGIAQISWSGAGTTTSMFNGWVVGLESHF